MRVVLCGEYSTGRWRLTLDVLRLQRAQLMLLVLFAIMVKLKTTFTGFILAPKSKLCGATIFLSSGSSLAQSGTSFLLDHLPSPKSEISP